MTRLRLALVAFCFAAVNYGCRTTGDGSEIRTASAAQQGPTSQAYSIWVRDGKVQKVVCDGQGTPRKMKNWSLKDDCKVVAETDLTRFKTAFARLYLGKERKKSMSREEKEIFEAAIATATLDETRAGVKKLPSDQFLELLAKYYSLVDKALNEQTPSTDAQAAGGYGLASAPFLTEFLNVPFGGVAMSPAFVLNQQVLAKRIKVEVSGESCGAVVSGVNIGQNTFNLGALKPLGSGEFVSNFPNKTLDIRVIQVVMSQTFFNFGQCKLTAIALDDQGGSGGATIVGFDFGGKRSCQAIGPGIACPAVVDAVQAACSQAGGIHQTCNDCSTLCNKNLSVPNQENWKLAGHIHFNGGFVPAMDVPVVPTQFIAQIRIDQPAHCPGASVLDVKVRVPLGAPLLKPTVKTAGNVWKPNGGDGAVITSIVPALNGPFFLGGCNIPVFVSSATTPVPLGLPINPNPPVAVGLPVQPPPVAVGLPAPNFDPNPQPLGLPVIDNSDPVPQGMPAFNPN